MQVSTTMACPGNDSSGQVQSQAQQGTKGLAEAKTEGRGNGSALLESSTELVLLRCRNGSSMVRRNDSATDGGESNVLYAEDGPCWSAEMVKVDLEGLTDSERFLLYRRRMNWTQREMAEKFSLHRNTYGRIEKGQNMMGVVEVPVIEELAPCEWCFLTRRRLGLSQQECADKMGISRVWLNKMEIGKTSCDALIRFWEC